MIRRLSAALAVTLLLLTMASSAGAQAKITYTAPPFGMSGTVTVGCIPKADSATGISCSLLSTDGTNMTLASGQMLLPDGSASAPSIGRLAVPGTGVYFGADVMIFNSRVDPSASGVRAIGNSGGRWSAGYFGGNTVVASTPMLDLAQTQNSAGVSFIGSTMAFTETAVAAGSRYFQILGGASASTDEFYILSGGTVVTNNLLSNGYVQSGSASYFAVGSRARLYSSGTANLDAKDSAGSANATVTMLNPIVTGTSSPASGAACTTGTITWDASYLYVCTASGVWKRAALTGGY